MAKSSNGSAPAADGAESSTPVAPQTRMIVVSARVPLPADQWEAATVMHLMSPAISTVQNTFREALNDPEFTLTTEIVTPRAVTGAKRGRKKKTADPIAAAAEGSEGAESAGQPSA